MQFAGLCGAAAPGMAGSSSGCPGASGERSDLGLGFSRAAVCLCTMLFVRVPGGAGKGRDVFWDGMGWDGRRNKALLASRTRTQCSELEQEGKEPRGAGVTGEAEPWFLPGC